MEQVNWQQLIDSAAEGFEPVPDDTYDVEVIKADHKPTTTGKPMYVVQFNIIAGPYVNRKLFNQFVVSPESPNALGFFFKHMGALGLPKDWFASNPSPEQICQALLGRRARLKVGHRDWGGQLRNDVTDVLPPGGVAPAPAQPGVAGIAPTPGQFPPPAAPPAAQFPPPAAAAPAPPPPPQPAPQFPPPQPQPQPQPQQFPAQQQFAPQPPAAPAPPAPPQAAPPQAAPPQQAAAAPTAVPGLPEQIDPEAFQQFLAQQAQANGNAPAPAPAPAAPGQPPF